jgi:hypothetical protein
LSFQAEKSEQFPVSLKRELLELISSEELRGRVNGVFREVKRLVEEAQLRMAA